MTAAPAFAFSCTKCGDCCKFGGPALSIEEVFKYQDVFISGLHWTGRAISIMALTKINDDYVDTQKLREQLALFSAPSFPDRGDEIYPHIYPVATGYNIDRPCSALGVDGTCNLHDNKPTMCRSVPFDPALPEAQQGTVLRMFRHDCMTVTEVPDAANIIFHDGRIADPSAKQDYDNRLAAMQKDRLILGSLAQMIGKSSRLAPTLNEFMSMINRAGWIETPMTALLFRLVHQKAISPADAERYIHSQMTLINTAIEMALQRRNSDERERTAAMRNYLASYRVMLKVGFSPLLSGDA